MPGSSVPVADPAACASPAMRVGRSLRTGAGRWAVALLLVLVGSALFAGVGDAATRNGMIAYEWSDNDGGFDLRVMRPDGGGGTSLFGSDAGLGAPRLSPDGNAVLIGGNPLLVADLARNDGVRRVGEGLAAWSPTSKRIVYGSYQAASDTVDIHVVGAGGTADELIRTEPDPCVVGEFSSGI